MTSTVVHANDLDRARALLANDPDEMDEEWLAEIIKPPSEPRQSRLSASASPAGSVSSKILRFQVGRDPLVEVNEFIQDLAHDIATEWEDYE